MKRTVAIVTIALATIVTSGCCGGFQRFLQHPLGPNSICEPVHRAHYDNGFEVGYGSECADCGLGSTGRPVCSCKKYGPGTTAGCLACTLADEGSGSARSTKRGHAVRQVSYTTGCNDCVEDDPCCGGCNTCQCCTPRCPETCVVGHKGPMSWLYTMLHPEKYYGGCGELYLGDFHSYPPDCTDPCNRCGRWTGESSCNAWTGCNVCGQCDAAFNETCTTCDGRAQTIEGSSTTEGPILMSQTDRVARPGKLRTARAKQSTYPVQRR